MRTYANLDADLGRLIGAGAGVARYVNMANWVVLLSAFLSASKWGNV
jgi:hypothetical protein